MCVCVEVAQVPYGKFTFVYQVDDTLRAAKDDLWELNHVLTVLLLLLLLLLP